MEDDTPWSSCSGWSMLPARSYLMPETESIAPGCSFQYKGYYCQTCYEARNVCVGCKKDVLDQKNDHQHPHLYVTSNRRHIWLLCGVCVRDSSVLETMLGDEKLELFKLEIDGKAAPQPIYRALCAVPRPPPKTRAKIPCYFCKAVACADWLDSYVTRRVCSRCLEARQRVCYDCGASNVSLEETLLFRRDDGSKGVLLCSKCYGIRWGRWSANTSAAAATSDSTSHVNNGRNPSSSSSNTLVPYNTGRSVVPEEKEKKSSLAGKTSTCSNCTFINDARFRRCEMCDHYLVTVDKAPAEVSSVTDFKASSGLSETRPCPKCAYVNFPHNTHCWACSADLPDAVFATSGDGTTAGPAGSDGKSDAKCDMIKSQANEQLLLSSDRKGRGDNDGAQEDSRVPCPACTFLNFPSLDHCQVCRSNLWKDDGVRSGGADSKHKLPETIRADEQKGTQVGTDAWMRDNVEKQKRQLRNQSTAPHPESEKQKDVEDHYIMPIMPCEPGECCPAPLNEQDGLRLKRLNLARELVHRSPGSLLGSQEVWAALRRTEEGDLVPRERLGDQILEDFLTDQLRYQSKRGFSGLTGTANEAMSCHVIRDLTSVGISLNLRSLASSSGSPLINAAIRRGRMIVAWFLFQHGANTELSDFAGNKLPEAWQIHLSDMRFVNFLLASYKPAKSPDSDIARHFSRDNPLMEPHLLHFIAEFMGSLEPYRIGVLD